MPGYFIGACNSLYYQRNLYYNGWCQNLMSPFAWGVYGICLDVISRSQFRQFLQKLLILLVTMGSQRLSQWAKDTVHKLQREVLRGNLSCSALSSLFRRSLQISAECSFWMIEHCCTLHSCFTRPAALIGRRSCEPSAMVKTQEPVAIFVSQPMAILQFAMVRFKFKLLLLLLALPTLGVAQQTEGLLEASLKGS